MDNLTPSGKPKFVAGPVEYILAILILIAVCMLGCGFLLSFLGI